MAFAQKLGKINTIVLLSIVYIIVIGLMALLVRLFRKDFLRRKMDTNLVSYWQIRHPSDQNLDRHKFQF